MSKINFNPARDWVVPSSKENEPKQASYYDATANQLHKHLEVLACGPNCEMVKVGDTVMVHPSSEGLMVEIDRKQYVMVSEFRSVEHSRMNGTVTIQLQDFDELREAQSKADTRLLLPKSWRYSYLFYVHETP